MLTSPWYWTAIGFLGQAMFSGRFLVQWIVSEKLRRSVVPKLFWYFSVAGGVTLLIYAIHRRDPVIIVGQAFGLVVYVRNLWLIHKSGGATASAETNPPVSPD